VPYIDPCTMSIIAIQWQGTVVIVLVL